MMGPVRPRLFPLLDVPRTTLRVISGDPLPPGLVIGTLPGNRTQVVPPPSSPLKMRRPFSYRLCCVTLLEITFLFRKESVFAHVYSSSIRKP